jgi:lipopolysaccharide/colanic/teichoic acid biosynthesis glycosyltransferase
LGVNSHRKTSFLYLAADIVTVAAVFNFVTLVRGVTTGVYFWALVAPIVVFAISIHLIDGYRARMDMLSLDYASLHFIASLSACVATIFLTFVLMPPGFELKSSRAAILLSFGLIGPVTLAYRRFANRRSVTEQGSRCLVFVGEKSEFAEFSAECARMGNSTPVVHADFGERLDSFEDMLESIAASGVFVEAFVVKESGNKLPSGVPMKLVQLYFEGIPTYTLELFHQVYWRKIPLYRINSIWLFQEGFKVAREPVFERIKRTSDLLLSVIGLLLSIPVITVAGVIIKLDDGGAIFFTQNRVGRHKVPFKLIKLRTMRETRIEGDPYTRQSDVRITRAGRILRKTRLDELPQLWNVFRGQMSLIGPRAEWDRLVAEYEVKIPSYHFRHLVKPGITGWAQVNYRYGLNIEDTLRKLEYDLYYIRNYSFTLDASIVLKTIHVMLLRKGR